MRNFITRPDPYTDLAISHIRLIRWHSPKAALTLEDMLSHNPYMAYQAALALLALKSRLQRSDTSGSLDEYLFFVKDYPEIFPLLEQAIRQFTADWQPARRKSDDHRAVRSGS